MKIIFSAVLIAATLITLAACGGGTPHPANTAPSLSQAAHEAGCTALTPDKYAGTAADAGCTYTPTGQRAELSTFSSPKQQATFVARSKSLGATVTAQGKGWVITGGDAPSPSANLLTCSTVVDQGGNGLTGTNLTAQHVIADLETMLLADGIRNLEPGGTPSADDATILDATALDLENYSGTQLANDASQFVSDEQNYDPSGPVDDTYATVVQADIRALLKDCPGAAAEGIKQAG
jgi:predicted small lipoprotein YifL